MIRALCAALLACAGCGGTSVNAVQVVLSASGVSPASICVSSAGQVKFSNHDSAEHQIASSSCAELNSPRLLAGGDFTATVGAGPKSCDYSDALDPSNASFQGVVSVGAPGNNCATGAH
jgi:hypothetical protein